MMHSLQACAPVNLCTNVSKGYRSQSDLHTRGLPAAAKHLAEAARHTAPVGETMLARERGGTAYPLLLCHDSGG